MPIRKKKPTAKSSDQSSLSNHEIVTLAVYLTGGATRAIDTEDVGVKANEVAPGRFTWRKYKDQINLEAVRKRLFDAKSPRLGFMLVAGSEADGWTLTEAGQQFCQQYLASNEALVPKRDATKRNDSRWFRSERARLVASQAFAAHSRGQTREITVRDAQAFFRLDEYVTGAARERKITRLVNAFLQDTELADLIVFLADLARSKVNEGT